MWGCLFSSLSDPRSTSKWRQRKRATQEKRCQSPTHRAWSHDSPASWQKPQEPADQQRSNHWLLAVPSLLSNFSPSSTLLCLQKYLQKDLREDANKSVDWRINQCGKLQIWLWAGQREITTRNDPLVGFQILTSTWSISGFLETYRLIDELSREKGCRISKLHNYILIVDFYII